MGLVEKLFGTVSARELKKTTPLQSAVLALEDKYRALSDDELRAMTPALKERLANGESLDDILPDAFAACREAADRVLSMRHFPVQVTGGIVLHQGKIAEMKTGEGKTLVSTLPAYLNALGGDGVHIVTVNDYLATRDSEWMGKVFSFLGLTVGLVVANMDPAQKREAYKADITYGTNNEFGFDYLRDNMVTNKANKAQRGHPFAIIDEVDSILVDEARTPLIISGPGEKSTDLYKRADDFAKGLKITYVVEHDDKTELDDVEGDVLVDEKARNVSLTKSGIDKAQRYFNVGNLADPDNMTISHHINQAIRAHGIMKRDVDYVVKDGEVIIVDEFTGRLMIGRRYSEGLHQAIEAKERVHVARENKTLATITLQNYFRMYKKLAGMTGTALTEKDEFLDIYGLDVVEIPTNKPMIREDMDDLIYKTERGKFNAVIEQIIECHDRDQPVLVGTVSIEKSELLSKLLKKRGVKHNVLNAKFHEKEATIVAQAGGVGAVTIATNMAGRGTDIMLGGNPEFLAKNEMAKLQYENEQIQAATSFFDTDDQEVLALRETYRKLFDKYKAKIEPEAKAVVAAGGLFIIGTERHESRRIDNQLRGRSGRQGDPGQSRFFLSLEDDLMRLFGGERMTSIMDTFNFDEDTPIEHKMVTNLIESSQKKIESRNFAIRKNVLNYDDVMNAQREIIYSQRDEVLDGKNMREPILEMIDESIGNNVNMFLADDEDAAGWNLSGLRNHYLGWLTSEQSLRFSKSELKKVNKADIAKSLGKAAHERYEDKEKRLGDDMRVLERLVLLRVIDSKWMDHIDEMDELRRGIRLRSYGQKNPVVEYRTEGFNMFDDMVASIREDTAKLVLQLDLVKRAPNSAAPPSKGSAPAAPPKKSAPAKEPPSPKPAANPKKKPGRNDPCPCGSGKKYKNCCGKTPEI